MLRTVVDVPAPPVLSSTSTRASEENEKDRDRHATLDRRGLLQSFGCDTHRVGRSQLSAQGRAN